MNKSLKSLWLKSAALALLFGLGCDIQAADYGDAAFNYAYSWNTDKQTVGEDDFVSFDVKGCEAPHDINGVVIPPNTVDRTSNTQFKITAQGSGWYLFEYQVRGIAQDADDPLVFELVQTSNGRGCGSQTEGLPTVIDGSRFESKKSGRMGEDDSYVVNGFGIAQICVPTYGLQSTTIQLRNNTGHKVHLKEKNKIVNASMKIIQIADPLGSPNLDFASAGNMGSQIVPQSGLVSFDDSLANPAGCVVLPGIAGQTDATTFRINCSGMYLFHYQVRGLPVKDNDDPLVFELLKTIELSGDYDDYFEYDYDYPKPVHGSRYQSERSEHTKNGDTQVVDGYVLAKICVPDGGHVNIQLHNVTHHSKVHLHGDPAGAITGTNPVNAAMTIWKIFEGFCAN